MNYRIGIDPGLTGAVACIDEQNIVLGTFDMPVLVSSKNKHQVNAAELAKKLGSWQKLIGNNSIIVFLEYVSARPGQGVSSMFNFGKACGIVEGIIGTLQLPLVMVTPQTWKKRAGLSGKEKDAARTLAQQLFPEVSLANKKDIARADALLIARYGLK